MSDPLTPVSELYARREAAALAALAQSRRNEEQARGDLARLQTLGDEYRANLAETAREGIRADALKHVRGFLAGLDRGIATQSQHVGRVAEKTGECARHWQDSKLRTHAIDTVRLRRQLVVQRRLSRREQHSQDELAARRRGRTDDALEGS